ncbi:MAG: serine/threonine protein kinase [Deltaproteobacteria bacterium]|nr:serine/threonine protein kinase [Deltaproteobacteria bacterium]
MAEGELENFPGWTTVEKLGEGGFCAVYRVRPAEGDGPERAVKVLFDRTAHAIERFAAEARLLQTIDHPNVVRVHALHDEVRPPWLVMDLLAGRDLEEAMKEQGPMDPERAARLYADVASGLATVHARGVRHRDIKTANIMLGHDGVPRLIDFGIARDPEAVRMTGKGMVMGTAAYLPPEVFYAEDPNAAQEDPAGDVYALGQALCESLTGRIMFDPGNKQTNGLVAVMKEKLDRAHLDPREWRPGVPAELADIVVAATKREVADRIRTADELERRLRNWLAARRTTGMAAPVSRVTEMPSVPVGAIPPSPPIRPPAEHREVRVEAGGGRGAAAAASFAGLGLVAAGWTLAALVGLLALWLGAPEPVQMPSAKPKVSLAVAGQRSAMGKCRRGNARGSAVLTWTVRDGRVWDVDVGSSNLGPEVDECLRGAVRSLRIPARDLTVTVRQPVTFR